MTTEAQNSLLKVLEEPPTRVVIMLLATECDKILTTIKSRVQYISMTRFTPEELAVHLPRISSAAATLATADKARLRGLILSSEGILGQAIRLTDKKLAEENEEERATALAFIRALRSGASYAEIYAASEKLPSKRPELQKMLEIIVSCVRDLIAVKYSQDSRLIFFSSRDEARELADAIGAVRLASIYDALAEAHEYCAKNAGVGNLVTNLIARASVGE
jgi:DNA polymerase III gamma/tau subunit